MYRFELIKKLHGRLYRLFAQLCFSYFSSHTLVDSLEKHDQFFIYIGVKNNVNKAVMFEQHHVNIVNILTSIFVFIVIQYYITELHLLILNTRGFHHMPFVSLIFPTTALKIGSTGPMNRKNTNHPILVWSHHKTAPAVLPLNQRTSTVEQVEE